MAAAAIQKCLEGANHYDKDNRFMAFSDLAQELAKDINIDASLERRIVRAILDRLEKDSSADVQAIAVRCLKDLVQRAQPDTIRDVCVQLAGHVLSDKAELRDVYAIGVKSTISEVQDGMGRIVADSLATPMLTGLRSPDTSIRSESVEILTTLTRRFGAEMGDTYEALLTEFLRILKSDSEGSLRKRASAALAALAAWLPDRLLQSMVDQILEGISSSPAGATAGAGGEDASQRARSLIQTIGGISREVGWRLGKHLDRIVPLLLTSIGTHDEEDKQDDHGAELRETSLHALESFLLRCPAEMTPFIDQVLDVTLEFIGFDPNYDYGADEDGDGFADDGMDEWGDEYGEYDDQEVDDDDDPSWKVRRSAVKTLGAIISSRPEMLVTLYERAARDLVDRFKEREESVKLEVFNAFTELLKSTVVVEGHAAFTLPASLQDKLNIAAALPSGARNRRILAPDTGTAAAAAAGLIQAPPLMRQKSVVDSLPDILPEIVTRAVQQLTASKSDKTKAGVFSMLRELALAVGGRLDAHLESLVEAVVTAAASDADGQVRLEALSFLRMFLDTAPARSFHPVLPKLVPAIASCVEDDWYKIIAEALRVVGRLAVVLRPRDPASGEFSEPAAEANSHGEALTSVVLRRLTVADVDQEVKDSAILSMGLLLSHVGDTPAVATRTAEILGLLLERLRNEITRMSVLKALSFVAISPLAPDLSSILNDSIAELTTLLRQKSRQLRQATLSALEALVTRHGGAISEAMAGPMLADAARMVSDDDLFLAHMALRLATSLMRANAALAGLVAERYHEQAKQLACSAMLQNPALDSLRAFYADLAGRSVPGRDAQSLLGELLQTVEGAGTPGAAAGAGAAGGARGEDGGVGKQAIMNVAKCAAALVMVGGDAVRRSSLARFVGDTGADKIESKLLGLFCVGELGALTNVRALDAQIADKVAASFASEVEDVKVAAAAALGGIAVGGGGDGLEDLAARLQTGGPSGYLLLAALREAITRHAPFEPSGPRFSAAAAFLPNLVSSASHEDEGVRAMAAECAGRLMVIDPPAAVPTVVRLLSSESAAARWTGITSLRYGLRQPALSELESHTNQFMSLLMDADLSVRYAALQTLTQAVHDAPLMVKRLMKPPSNDGGAEVTAPSGSIDDVGVAAVLFYEMVPRAELKREVELGPFKHKIDDGLPLRKAAFACIDSLFDRMEERVGSSFLPRLCDGLRDVDDVAMQAHQILIKLTGIPVWQRRVVADLDNIAPALRSAFGKIEGTKKKSAEGGGADVIRSALRAMDAVAKNCADSMTIRPFADLVDFSMREPQLSSVLAEIQESGK